MDVTHAYTSRSYQKQNSKDGGDQKHYAIALRFLKLLTGMLDVVTGEIDNVELFGK